MLGGERHYSSVGYRRGPSLPAIVRLPSLHVGIPAFLVCIDRRSAYPSVRRSPGSGPVARIPMTLLRICCSQPFALSNFSFLLL